MERQSGGSRSFVEGCVLKGFLKYERLQEPACRVILHVLVRVDEDAVCCFPFSSSVQTKPPLNAEEFIMRTSI